MARKERLDLIKKLEKERDSKVLCYITGDRQNVGAQIHSDVVRHIYDHLIAISKNQERGIKNNVNQKRGYINFLFE